MSLDGELEAFFFFEAGQELVTTSGSDSIVVIECEAATGQRFWIGSDKTLFGVLLKTVTFGSHPLLLSSLVHSGSCRQLLLFFNVERIKREKRRKKCQSSILQLTQTSEGTSLCTRDPGLVFSSWQLIFRCRKCTEAAGLATYLRWSRNNENNRKEQ